MKFIFYYVSLFLIISSCTEPTPPPDNDLDTTSHNFTWQIYEFGGQKSSSVFYDIAIVNEKDIWAVGEIYTEDSYTYDSLGNWIEPYNAAHWNGEKWELKRLYFIYQGSNLWSPIHTILSFDSNDIWFGPGIHWDGKKFNSKPMNISFPYRVNKMWGMSSEDFYIVGNDGAIAHYNSRVWTKIEIGTNLDIQDIWGSQTDEDGKTEILLVASNFLSGRDRKLLQIEPVGTVKTLDDSPIYRALRSIWFIPDKTYYTCGFGLYKKRLLDDKEWYDLTSVSEYALLAIRGIAINDIFTCGGYGEVIHYNGQTWKSYQDILSINGNYHAISFIDNIVAIVGTDGRKAYVVIGKRN